MKVPRDFRRAVEAAEAAGWQLESTRNSHLRLVPPEPIVWGDQVIRSVVFPSTASDHRAVKNFEAMLRRCGLTW